MYNYGYNYGSTSSAAAEGVFAALFAVLGVVVLVCLAIAVLQIIGQWKVLTKAEKPGWGALIPFYNTYLMCQVAGVNPWWVLIVALSPILSVIPVLGSLASFAVSIYFSVLLGVSVARSFGKSDGFAVGLILAGPIFYMILGFGDSKYEGPKPMKDLLFDNINKDSNSTSGTAKSANTKFCSECGHKVDAKSSFCSNCGKSIK